MFETIFGEFPIRYYNYKDYDKAINDLVADTLGFANGDYKRSITSYTMKEEEGCIVFKCLAPSIEKDQIEMSIKNRMLSIKTSKEIADLDFFRPLDFTFKLSKDVDASHSYAELLNGVLKIVMPLKEDVSVNKISFR